MRSLTIDLFHKVTLGLHFASAGSLERLQLTANCSESSVGVLGREGPFNGFQSSSQSCREISVFVHFLLTANGLDLHKLASQGASPRVHNGETCDITETIQTPHKMKKP